MKTKNGYCLCCTHLFYFVPMKFVSELIIVSSRRRLIFGKFINHIIIKAVYVKAQSKSFMENHTHNYCDDNQ